MADHSPLAAPAEQVRAVTPGSAGCKSDGESTLCAICLEEIILEEYSEIKGCEHAYCVHCILDWAEHARKNEDPRCPQCKSRFAYLLSYRQLDGAFSDFLVQESVCLLLRACWRAAKGGKQPLTGNASDAHGDLIGEDDYDDDDQDDEEDLLARHHRVLLCNRRYGANGFISNGRMLARPAPQHGAGSARSKQQPRQHSGQAQAIPTRATEGTGSMALGGARRTSTDASGSRAAALPPHAPGASPPTASGAAAARNSIRAKREAREAQKAQKEACRRARRLERWGAADGGAEAGTTDGAAEAAADEAQSVGAVC